MNQSQIVLGLFLPADQEFAKAIVPGARALNDPAAGRAYSLSAEQRAVQVLVARLSAEELAMVERFMERRHELAPPVRGQLAEQVAAPLRTRAGPAVGHLEAEQFLERLYQARLRG